MGLLDSVKNAVGLGQDETTSDDIAQSFEEELEEEEMLEDEFEEDVSEDEGPGPWENAYKFAEDMLENDGHVSMMDFTKKVMFHEIETSPIYRDRIEQGVQTINQIATAKESIEELRGSGESMDYGERAQQLEAANELIDQVDKLEGKEDQIVREALNVGRDVASALAENATQPSGSVDSSVERTGERLE